MTSKLFSFSNLISKSYKDEPLDDIQPESKEKLKTLKEGKKESLKILMTQISAKVKELQILDNENILCSLETIAKELKNISNEINKTPVKTVPIQTFLTKNFKTSEKEREKTYGINLKTSFIYIHDDVVGHHFRKGSYVPTHTQLTQLAKNPFLKALPREVVDYEMNSEEEILLKEKEIEVISSEVDSRGKRSDYEFDDFVLDDGKRDDFKVTKISLYTALNKRKNTKEIILINFKKNKTQEVSKLSQALEIKPFTACKGFPLKIKGGKNENKVLLEENLKEGGKKLKEYLKLPSETKINKVFSEKKSNINTFLIKEVTQRKSLRECAWAGSKTLNSQTKRKRENSSGNRMEPLEKYFGNLGGKKKTYY